MGTRGLVEIERMLSKIGKEFEGLLALFINGFVSRKPRKEGSLPVTYWELGLLRQSRDKRNKEEEKSKDDAHSVLQLPRLNHQDHTFCQSVDTLWIIFLLQRGTKSPGKSLIEASTKRPEEGLDELITRGMALTID